MKIAKTDNYSFGKIQAPTQIKKSIKAMLAAKDIAFAENFRQGWEKCKHTQYVDLIISADRKVFIQDKLSGNKKRIDSFNALLHNVYSGIKHVIFAEENKFHF